MIRDEIESVETTSPNILVEQTEQLKLIFPQVFSEGKIDFKKLRAALGDMVDTQPERYSFTWAGKRNATLLLQTPSYATLTPAEDESVNFANTQNLFIEGDNLEVLKLLYKSYSGRVKMIYIDPPYNTGNDFVYPDNYTDPLENYLEVTGQKDAAGNLLTSNPETSGRYHSAWLSMMYPRLYLARQLLCDDGVIFVSIDDHEVYDLRLLMNEVFGEENYLATFVWRRRTPSALADKLVSVDHEYVVAYQRGSFESFIGHQKDYSSYSNPNNDPEGDWAYDNPTVGMTKAQRPNQFYDLVDPKTGRVFPANPNRVWAFIPETMAQKIAEGRIVFPEGEGKRPLLKRFKKDLKTDVNPISTWIKSLGEKAELGGFIELETGLNAEGTRTIQDLFGTTVFNYAKPASLITSLMKYATKGDDIILDLFAGSCTTAQAVLELNHKDDRNRHFIMVQLPEPTNNPQYPTIADIGKERIRRVIAKLRSENQDKLGLTTREGPEDLGFRVFKLSPSNYKQWKSIDASDPEAYSKQLELFADLLVENWEPVNVLWEVVNGQ